MRPGTRSPLNSNLTVVYPPKPSTPTLGWDEGNGGPPSFYPPPGLAPGTPVVEMTTKGKKGKGKDLKNRSAKAEMRDRLRKKFFQEISSYLSKSASPWHAFACIYAGLSGGHARVDDLIKSYPYDFYTASIWDDRKNTDYEYARDGDYPDDDDTNEAYGGLEEKIAHAIKTILQESSSIKPESPERAELLRLLRESLMTVYLEYTIKGSKKKEEAEKIKRSLEKTGKGFENMIFPSFRRNLYDVKKEASRLDIDDILYGGGDGDGDGEVDSPALSAMGMCMLKPEFKGLIVGCTAKINLICKKDFTSFELCTSPEIDAMFATFMNLFSSSPNPRVPVLPGRTGFRNYNAPSGNSVYVQPQQSRYVMENSKVEIMGAYHWFRFVDRSPYGGILYHTEDSSPSPTSATTFRRTGTANRSKRRHRYEPYESASYPRMDTNSEGEEEEDATSISSYLSSI